MVPLGLKALPVMTGLLGHKAQLVMMVLLECKALLVMTEPLGHKALPEMMVLLVRKVLPVTMELLGRKDRKANVAVMVLLARKAPQGPGHQTLA